MPNFRLKMSVLGVFFGVFCVTLGQQNYAIAACCFLAMLIALGVVYQAIQSSE